MRQKIESQIEAKQEELHHLQMAFALDIKFIDDDYYEEEATSQLLQMKELKAQIKTLSQQLELVNVILG